MKGQLMVTAAVLMAVAPAWADRAVPRSGSTSSSSSAGSRHTSSSSSSSGSGSRVQNNSSSHSSSSRSSQPATAAQSRHPRPGTGTGWSGYHGYRPRYYGHGYGYYNSFYYPSYYGLGLGYGYGYGPYTYGYGYGPRYYSVRHYDRDGEGAIRVLVDPNKTRVYVDGYYAGTADDFDGMFQRLYVRSGRHQITLKLEGYKTRHFRVFVPFDDTVKIKLDMESGTGEVEAEDVIGRPEDARGFEDERRQRATDWQRQRGHVPDADDADDAADDDDADDTPDVRGEMAIVQLDVAPPDATVYVDGEFQGRGERVRSLSLPPGKHRIEIVRPGYRTLEREIDVRAGSRTNLDLTLER